MMMMVTTTIEENNHNSYNNHDNNNRNNKKNCAFIRLSFASLEELQTRLVLLPRVEEEGTGAIAIVQPLAVPSSASAGTTTTTTHSTTTASTLSSSSSSAAATGAKEEEEMSVMETIDVRNSNDPMTMPLTFLEETEEGCLYEVFGLEQDYFKDNQQTSSWRDKEFEEILADIRAASPPLVLYLVKPKPDSDSDSSEAPAPAEALSAKGAVDVVASHNKDDFEEKKEDECCTAAERMISGRSKKEEEDAQQKTSSTTSATTTCDATSTEPPQPQPPAASSATSRAAADSSTSYSSIMTSLWTSRVKATAQQLVAASEKSGTTGAAALLLAQAKELRAAASTRLSVTTTSSSAASTTTTTAATTITNPATTTSVVLSREKSLMDDDDDAVNDEDDNAQQVASLSKQQQEQQQDKDHSPKPQLGLYLNSSSGEWLPLKSSSSSFFSACAYSAAPLSALSPTPTSSTSTSTTEFLTNSSVVAVRISETQPFHNPHHRTTPSANGTTTAATTSPRCDAWKFQWYRSNNGSSSSSSCLPPTPSTTTPKVMEKKSTAVVVEALMITSSNTGSGSGGGGSSSSNSTTTTTTDAEEEDDPNSNNANYNDNNWTLLEGATHAAFQPTACEVGHRLRCVVVSTFQKRRIQQQQQSPPPLQQAEKQLQQQEQTSVEEKDNESSSSSGSTSDMEEETEAVEMMILETDHVVRAALPLFNGSRQALIRAAQFAGLQGRGKLEGRSFLLKVAIGSMVQSNNKRNSSRRRTTSAVTIYQVSGQTAEPMHSEDVPILGVSARVPDYSNAKGFELVFAHGIPESSSGATSMVQALAADKNCFELQAPNRMSRESILLAIGVANYLGKPVDLDDSTILYSRPSGISVSSVENNAACHSFVEDDASSCSSYASCNSSNSPKENQRGTPPASPPTFPGYHNSPSSELNPAPPRMMNASALTSSLPTTMKPPLFPDASSPTGVMQPHKRSLSLDHGRSDNQGDAAAAAAAAIRIKELEDELRLSQVKLDRKNKVVAELQRSISQTETSFSQAQSQAAEREASLKQVGTKNQSLLQSLRLAEKRLGTQEATLMRVRKEHDTKLDSAANEIAAQSGKIAELEKMVRTLQNDKAVLSAAVEARESKLAKMATLQRSFDNLSAKTAENESLRKEVEDGNKRYKEKCSDVEESLEREKILEAELGEVRAELAARTQQRDKEKARTASHQTEHGQLQLKIQKLIAERNNYKQKSESLSKEMARVCKNGRTVREVERILAEDASRRQEVEVLREQKKKASEELQKYQILYEQSRRVQLMAGMDFDMIKLLERITELERLHSELTEYVSAKEMQLDTMKQVNDALQVEIRDLAKANMCKHDV